MKKLVAKVLTAALLVAIVVTPRYSFSKPCFSNNYIVHGNQNYSGDIFTQ